MYIQLHVPSPITGGGGGVALTICDITSKARKCVRHFTCIFSKSSKVMIRLFAG